VILDDAVLIDWLNSCQWLRLLVRTSSVCKVSITEALARPVARPRRHPDRGLGVAGRSRRPEDVAPAGGVAVGCELVGVEDAHVDVFLRGVVSGAGGTVADSGAFRSIDAPGHLDVKYNYCRLHCREPERTVSMRTKEEQTSRIVRPLRGGQITIPAEFRRRLGITGDGLLRLTLVGHELLVTPIRIGDTAEGSAWFRELYEQFEPVREEAASLDEAEIDAAIRDAVDASRTENETKTQRR
jgi:bifunctional DNA-binding transcriptional regulator/antitoxin component of YhaV-PrlF toxin-antitoxin module